MKTGVRGAQDTEIGLIGVKPSGMFTADTCLGRVWVGPFRLFTVDNCLFKSVFLSW